MNRTKINRKIIGAMVAAVVLVLAGLLGWLAPVRWAYDHTVVPAVRGLSAVGSNAGEAISNLGRVRDLARDNDRLARENADLRQRLASDAETQRDNELLRKQLGLEVASATRQVATEVVSFQPDSYRQFVTVNKGSKAGIKPGMAVVSDGVLIGVVAEAHAATARIMLVTDPEFKLTAKDQDTAATGIVRGQLGGGLVLDKIGQTDTVKPGDTVTTSGLGGLVPAGLYIGRVESVNTRANVVFQSAQVETTVKASRLRFAYVVLTP